MYQQSHLWLLSHPGLLFLFTVSCANPGGHISILIGVDPSTTGSAPGQVVSLQPGSKKVVTFSDGLRASTSWFLYTAFP
jgi:hypothetical protein